MKIFIWSIQLVCLSFLLSDQWSQIDRLSLLLIIRLLVCVILGFGTFSLSLTQPTRTTPGFWAHDLDVARREHNEHRGVLYRLCRWYRGVCHVQDISGQFIWVFKLIYLRGELEIKSELEFRWSSPIILLLFDFISECRLIFMFASLSCRTIRIFLGKLIRSSSSTSYEALHSEQWIDRASSLMSCLTQFAHTLCAQLGIMRAMLFCVKVAAHRAHFSYWYIFICLCCHTENWKGINFRGYRFSGGYHWNFRLWCGICGWGIGRRGGSFFGGVGIFIACLRLVCSAGTGRHLFGGCRFFWLSLFLMRWWNYFFKYCRSGAGIHRDNCDEVVDPLGMMLRFWNHTWIWRWIFFAADHKCLHSACISAHRVLNYIVDTFAGVQFPIFLCLGARVRDLDASAG